METRAIDKEGERPLECIHRETGKQLTAYEFGWLSIPEAHRFEEHLQTCRACVQDLRRMAPVWAVLQDNPEIVEPEKTPAPVAPFPWPAWFGRSGWQISVVISMLLLVGTVYMLQPPAEDRGLLLHETVHLRQPAGSPPLTQGLQALRRGDIGLAKTFFQKALTQNPESYEANYLLGLMILKEAEREQRVDPDKLNSTIAHLQKAILVSERWDNPVYAAQSYYYLARAYAAQKDPARALDVLAWIDRLPAGDPDLSGIKQRAADLKILCRP